MSSRNTSGEKKQVRLLGDSGCLTQEALLSFAFGQLSDYQSREVEQHLQGCEICPDALEGIKLSGSYQQAEEAIESVRDKIDERTGRQKSRAVAFSLPSFLEYRKLAAAVALVIVFSGVAVYVISNFTSSEHKLAEETNLSNDQLVELNKKNEGEIKEAPAWTETINETADSVYVSTPQSGFFSKEVEPPRTDDKVAETVVMKESQSEIRSVPQKPAEVSVQTRTDANQIPATSPPAAKTELGTISVEDKAGFAAEEKNMELAGAIAPAGGDDGKSKRKENVKPEQVEDTRAFMTPDQLPEFPGGVPALAIYIKQNLKYPEQAKQNQIEGKVYVSFIISASGKVTNAKVDRGISPECDQEALRVVSSMPNWKPGKKKGKEADMKYFLPIQFTLSDTQ